MKILLALVAICAIALGVYYYLEPDRVRGWLKDADLVRAPETTRVYKWQDKQGNWHISNTPPSEQAAVEVQDYRSDQNIMPLPPQLQKDN